MKIYKNSSNIYDLNRINKDSYENWIFDLDNTLYNINLGVFQKISERITLYIMEKFSLKKKESEQLRREMFLKYGLTLSGLMVEKNIKLSAEIQPYTRISMFRLQLSEPHLKTKKVIFSRSIKQRFAGLNLMGCSVLRKNLAFPKPRRRS